MVQDPRTYKNTERQYIKVLKRIQNVMSGKSISRINMTADVGCCLSFEVNVEIETKVTSLNT